jgi:hypothetical protein
VVIRVCFDDAMVLINKSGHIKAIVYHDFLSHVNARLASTIDHIDIRIPQAMEIGSDDEKALTKSIQMCFPEAERSLCTKHLKDNVQYTSVTKYFFDYIMSL